eukprot:1977103-Rhodomonas_salina.1
MHTTEHGAHLAASAHAAVACATLAGVGGSVTSSFNGPSHSCLGTAGAPPELARANHLAAPHPASVYSFSDVLRETGGASFTRAPLP